jgi:hypothetical protein
LLVFEQSKVEELIVELLRLVEPVPDSTKLAKVEEWPDQNLVVVL